MELGSAVRHDVAAGVLGAYRAGLRKSVVVVEGWLEYSADGGGDGGRNSDDARGLDDGDASGEGEGRAVGAGDSILAGRGGTAVMRVEWRESGRSAAR